MASVFLTLLCTNFLELIHVFPEVFKLYQLYQFNENSKRKFVLDIKCPHVSLTSERDQGFIFTFLLFNNGIVGV